MRHELNDLAQIDIEELEGARELFEAYCNAVGGFTYDGKPIPGWHDLSDKVRYGWVCAYRRAVYRLAR